MNISYSFFTSIVTDLALQNHQCGFKFDFFVPKQMFQPRVFFSFIFTRLTLL